MRNLSDIKIGETVTITSFDNPVTRADFARFALFEGQKVKCIAKPGPLVIRENHQTIAIEKEFSQKIYIK